MGGFRKDFNENNYQLAINLSVATIASLTLILMVVVNQYTYQSISKKPECVFVPWSFFEDLDPKPNPYKLDVLSEGSEAFLKRIYQYYLSLPWILDETQSYYISPVSIFLVMGYIAAGLNNDESVMDYGVTSLEEMLVGMSFPCLQGKLAQELALLLKQEEDNLVVTAYIDKDYDARKFTSLFPNTSLQVTRDVNKLPLLIRSNQGNPLRTETYFSLEPTTYRLLKFALHIDIDIFAGLTDDDMKSSTESPDTPNQQDKDDALIVLSKHSNDSMDEYRYTHIDTERYKNNSLDEDGIAIEFLDKNDLTWKTSTRKFVENDQRINMDNNVVTFRCNDVTIHNLTSINTEAIVLKNPEKTNLTLVLLSPYTHNDFSTLKKYFSGTDFQKYEKGEGHDEFSFRGALTIQLPLVSGKTSYLLPIPLQMNAITRIFYDGREGDQFHKTVTDWSNIVGCQQKLHVPSDGLWHTTAFDSERIAKLFGEINSNHTPKKTLSRNTEWKPEEPIRIESPFMFYIRGKNEIIYQFGKVNSSDSV